MELITLYLKDSENSFETQIYKIPFDVSQNDASKGISLLGKIVCDYLDTEEARDIMLKTQKNKGYFIWRDLLHIPETFLNKYGVQKIGVSNQSIKISVWSDKPMLYYQKKAPDFKSGLTIRNAGAAFHELEGCVLPVSINPLYQLLYGNTSKPELLPGDKFSKWYVGLYSEGSAVPLNMGVFQDKQDQLARIVNSHCFFNILDGEKYSYKTLKELVNRLYSITTYQLNMKPGKYAEINQAALDEKAFSKWVEKQISCGNIEDTEGNFNRITLNLDTKNGFEMSKTFLINPKKADSLILRKLLAKTPNEKEKYLRMVSDEYCKKTDSWVEDLFDIPSHLLLKDGIEVIETRIVFLMDPKELSEQMAGYKEKMYRNSKCSYAFSYEKVLEDFGRADHSIYPSVGYWISRMLKKGKYSIIQNKDKIYKSDAETFLFTFEDSYPELFGRRFRKNEVMKFYKECINKNISSCGYPDFECWLSDMLKTGLIVKKEISPEYKVFRKATIGEKAIRSVCNSLGIPDKGQAYKFVKDKNITDKDLYAVAEYLLARSRFKDASEDERKNFLELCMNYLSDNVRVNYTII